MAETRLLRIGEFSTLTRLSVRMLRHYDAHGVLSPACTDGLTGYRFYAPEQVADALLIRQLRDVGFSVSAIAALLPLRREPELLRRALDVQREHLVTEARAAELRLARIDQLISITSITQGRAIMAELTTTTHPAHRVVALRTVIPTYQDEGQAWDQLMSEVAAQQVPLADEPCGATFHDPEYKESDVDVEVWLTVQPGTEVRAPLVARDVPEQRVAVALVRGPYELIGSAVDELGAHLDAEGLTIAGPMYNRYLVGPAQSEEPAEYVTEVCLPVA